MAFGMQSYEEELAACKRSLFADLLQTSTSSLLEVGIGTGPNFKYYSGHQDMKVVGLDPNPEMELYANQAADAAGLSQQQVQLLPGVAEQMPVADHSQDAVVCTLVLCSVPSVQTALQEIKRVLKPGGKLLFIEHVAASKGQLRLLQNLLNPLQQAAADGCHLNRDTLKSVQSAGFASVNASNFTVPGLGLIGPHVAGIATMA